MGWWARSISICSNARGLCWRAHSQLPVCSKDARHGLNGCVHSGSLRRLSAVSGVCLANSQISAVNYKFITQEFSRRVSRTICNWKRPEVCIWKASQFLHKLPANLRTLWHGADVMQPERRTAERKRLRGAERSRRPKRRNLANNPGP